MVVETAKRQDRIRRLHDLAEEVRTAAEGMHDLQYKRTMVLIAESYDHMANRLEFLSQHLSLPEEPSPGLSPGSEAPTIAEPK
jgi:predicted HAD superfamily phosphohydrolase